MSDLALLNGLHDPDRIYPGEQLVTERPSSNQPAAAAAVPTYRVKKGDSLWSISRQTHVSVGDLANLNHIQSPYVIHAGQVLMLAAPAAPSSPSPPAPKRSLSVQAARALLTEAARDHGLRPSFVQAVSYWESGWNQDVVSSTGAVGLMQIEPYTAAYAGPRYLGRKVDISNPRDNAQLGAALLRAYVDQFNDPKLALAAYYQGPVAAQKYGIYPSSQSYVNGIWDLRNRIEAGQL